MADSCTPSCQDPDHEWRASFFDMLWSQGERSEGFAHPGWSVYRNTTQWACLSALAANYPALAALSGEAVFGLMARAYLQTHRPVDARLWLFGSELPDFLAHFEPAQDWPHWVDVAWLDRLWMESHVAAEAPALTACDVFDLGLDPRQSCTPHPATRWRWSDEHPIATLWREARAGHSQSDGLNWTGEGLLLTRPQDHVQSCPLGLAGACFLDACHRGETLEQSMALAMQADGNCDLAALVAQLLEQGALSHPTPQKEMT